MSAVMKQQQQQQATALAPLESLKRSLFPQIKALVPDDEAMAKSLFASAVRLASDPKIMACTQNSIINCFTRAIDLDLNLDPAYGEVYFIPYKDWRDGSVTELTVQLGAKGLAAMAQSLGGWQIQIIPVFNCDTYEVKKVFKNGWMETETTLEFNEAERELHIHDQAWVHLNLRAIVATARRKENGEWVTISLEPAITRNEIERRRMMSNNQKSYPKMEAGKRARLESGLPIGVWQDHYLAMAEKTALAAMARKLPKNKGTEKLLNTLNSDAIDSTSTVIDDRQVALPVPANQDKPIEHLIPAPEPAPAPDSVQDHSSRDEMADDAEFTDVQNFDSPVNVDIETGEILAQSGGEKTADDVANEVISKPLITFTEEKYLKGALAACKNNKQLTELWETVPAELQQKYQEQFNERQDLMR